LTPKIYIDETLCNGCGRCITTCAEGSLKIVNGKAHLVNEALCDGLGACLNTCPQGAISKEETGHRRDLITISIQTSASPPLPRTCIGESVNFDQATDLRHWPVQISLLPIRSPLFRDAHLTISADCVPFAYRDFHLRFVAGKRVCTGCPKLDDIKFYEGKLEKIISLNEIRKIEVAYMEVPCCGALPRAVSAVRKRLEKSIPLTLTRVGIDGRIIESKTV